ncbi:GFA family protein [Sphingomonas sp. Y38-1Y]|uniref:GFA family protein n=1 Tax=Sphingomonas sp. Y38-1Y TaxID=3078265 RepID=UPI0028EE5CCE|nr:GFA family protein [Sphingomonas sp. Y38-1Y]
MTMTGGCQCGAVRYSAEGSAEHHAICHCADCRRASGAPMVGWIAFKEEAVSVEGTPVRHESSPGVTREFCGTCGTGLFYRNPAVLPGLVDVQSATLDTPEAAPPGAEIMVRDRLAWLDTVPDLPKFNTYPGMD